MPARAPRSRTVAVFAFLAAAGCRSKVVPESRELAPTERPAASPPAPLPPSPTPSVYAPTVENDRAPPGPAAAGMVWIPGGEFSMGGIEPEGGAGTCMDALTDAQPVHRVYVDGFWMDATEVTNEQFERFVRATGYETVAERTPTQEEYPDAPPEKLIAGSVVFSPPVRPVPLDSQRRWWAYRKGASWRHPDGPKSGLRGRAHYPVVQVSYDDAVAYATWAGKRLPTEAEFEFAARGGLSGKRFAWGDDFKPGDRWMANVFEGHFPDRDDGADGWAGIAPVASFPPNGYGLYDIAGNVWEWTADWYRSDYYASFDRDRTSRNPRGPEDSRDPSEPGVAKRVQRGGSFLCSSEYCTRYLVGSRGRGEPSSAANHLGFRCVEDGAR